MNKIEYVMKLMKVFHMGEDAYEITFLHDETFTYLPGQYIWIVLPKLLFPDPKGERRAFSIITSTQNSNEISIIFRMSESGYKKTIISMQEGDEVKAIGPFGSSYVLDEKRESSIVMISGGVAIAPFISIIRSYNPSNPIKLKLIFTHSSDHSCFGTELLELAKEKNIPFTNFTGGFSEKLLFSDINYAIDHFFICGPQGLIEKVYEVLSKKDVPYDHMHFEQNYPKPKNNLTEKDFIQKQGEKNIMLQAIQDSKNHVIVTDANGQIIFANKQAEKNTGFTFDEMRGNTPRIWGSLMSPDFYRTFWKQKHSPAGFDGQLMNRRKNGELYYVIHHISPIMDEEGTVIGYIGTEEDITEGQQLKQELELKVQQLERTNRLMVGRELQMKRMKEEMRKLNNQ